MIAEILFTVFVISVPFWCGREKPSEPERLPAAEPTRKTQPDFDSIEEKIDALVQVRKQLENAEDGVNSVLKCDAAHQSEFQLKYTSAKTGKNTVYRFWLDGENQETDMLLRLMESEQSRLRAVLLESIADLREQEDG